MCVEIIFFFFSTLPFLSRLSFQIPVKGGIPSLDAEDTC